jgi:hypothetical protein
MLIITVNIIVELNFCNISSKHFSANENRQSLFESIFIVYQKNNTYKTISNVDLYL